MTYGTFENYTSLDLSYEATGYKITSLDGIEYLFLGSNLKTVNLSGNKLTTVDTVHFGKMLYVENLDLSNNTFVKCDDSNYNSITNACTMNAQELTENLKLWDKKLSSLETDFMQTTSYDGVEVSRSKGKLFYDRTLNRLRLDTLNTAGETEQTAITDKQEIVILDENNQHVTTLSWTDWQQGQPNQALFDFGNYTALVDRHTSSVKSQDGQTAVLALIPKEGEEYTLYLTLSKRDFFPEVITIESDLMITRADLKNTRKNQPLPADIFGGFNNK